MAASYDLKEISLRPYQTSDSRGRPTVEVELKLGDITTVGDVPAGASKGEDEAKTVSVEQALENITGAITEIIKGHGGSLNSHEDVVAVENLIIGRSGENYVGLGANSVLPVSRALWKAAAASHGLTLSSYIRKFQADLVGEHKVAFLMNIFNGGLHALKEAEGEKLGVDRIDIQEVMVVPMAETYKKALEMGDEIDQALKKILEEKYPVENITRADEAGFSVKGLGDSTLAFELVFDAIRSAGYEPGKDVKLALDVAASSFYDRENGTYQFRGESISSDEMIAYLVGLVDRFEGCMLSIEDGLDENDWEAWTKLTAELNKRDVVTIGDDLFVTQLPRLERGIDAKAATGILVKVNQNGSVGGTLEVMKRARDAGMKCVISHRSGETLDDSIADLAYGTGSFGLKTGDPQPPVDFPDQSVWVRRRKYLRMVELEAMDN